jgi:hypothetical protein
VKPGEIMPLRSSEKNLNKIIINSSIGGIVVVYGFPSEQP